MARINSGHATRFNRRHGRVGFLFQNRFGSRIVESDEDLISVVRYVARNPVKHGLCPEEALDEHPWGSMSALMGRRPPWPFEAIADTSAILEGCVGFSASSPSDIHSAGSPPRSDETFDGWIERICCGLSVSRDLIATRRRIRSISDARAAACWIGVTRLGLSGARIGARLGMSRSAVSRALARGHVVCRALGFSGSTTQQLNQRPG